jgi:predicted SnoaL-like aldol condensation-catalyzing enzyme
MCKFMFICSILLLTSGCTSLQAKQSPISKEIVTSFFELGFVEREPVKAAEKYISKDKYIQHNPQGRDGRQAFIEGFAAYILSSDYSCEIKRVIAEGDLVSIHNHCKENEAATGAAIVDIFRVENGLIVEHWDVEQAIPEKSANSNTMF